MHGSGLTRHGIEHRFRKPRKVAAEMISKQSDTSEVTNTNAEVDAKKKKRKANVVADDVTKPASARKRIAAARRPAVVSCPPTAHKASTTAKDEVAIAQSDLAVNSNPAEDADETESMPLTEDESGDESFSATESASES